MATPSNGPAVEKKQSLARGRYRCSLCGAFKVLFVVAVDAVLALTLLLSHCTNLFSLQTNHVCALIADKLMCNMSTQSLQANDLVASMLPAHQKELRVQCRSGPGISSSSTSVGNAPLSSAAILGPAASTTTSAGGLEVPRVFHERIVTVTRNRTSIQHAEPSAPMSAVSYSTTPMTMTTSMTTSEASNDGSTVLSLHNPTGPQVHGQGLATASVRASGAHAVTPTATYSFAPHFAPHLQSHLQSTQPAGLALPVGPGGYMYSNAMHSSLLSVPLQPSTLASAAVPSFPQVHHPHQSQAPVKVAPSLIYPSALDLLGQAIYE